MKNCRVKNGKNWKKHGGLSNHHLIPKERVKLGTVPLDEIYQDYNRVLTLWRDRHNYWHYLFRNMTIGEIIKILQRIQSIKYCD